MSAEEQVAMSIVDKTVSEVIGEQPARAAVFERHGISSITWSNASVRAAATARHTDIVHLLKEFAEADRLVGENLEGNWYEKQLRSLVEKFETSFHHRFNDEFPQLLAIIGAARGPGHGYAEPREIRECVFGWAMAVQSHITCYRQMLLPICSSMQKSKQALQLSKESINSVIDLMDQANKSAQTEWSKVRQLTRNFTSPPDADSTYVLMLEAVRALSNDFRLHCQQEHTLLFPILKLAHLEMVKNQRNCSNQPQFNQQHDPLVLCARSWKASPAVQLGGFSNRQYSGIAILVITILLAGYCLYPVLNTLFDDMQKQEADEETQVQQARTAEPPKTPGILYPLIEETARSWTRNQPR